MSLPFYISELRGYLKALELLSLPNKCHFGVRYHPFNGNVLEFLENEEHGYLISRYAQIPFEQLKEKALHIVFGGSANPISSMTNREVLAHDIAKYYNLASASENKRGMLHPLTEGPVYEVHFADKDERSSFVFLVKIENYVVFTEFTNHTLAAYTQST